MVTSVDDDDDEMECRLQLLLLLVTVTKVVRRSENAKSAAMEDIISYLTKRANMMIFVKVLEGCLCLDCY